MAGSNSLRSKGRIQMCETSHLQIITFGLQHTAGPYRCANYRHPGPTQFPTGSIYWDLDGKYSRLVAPKRVVDIPG